MGREIAFVMGIWGRVGWSGPTRELEEQPRKAIELMELKENGCGGGYWRGKRGTFSFRWARRCGRKDPGSRYPAGDVDEITKIARRRQIENVEPILGRLRIRKLPEGKVDVALMVDAYHEFDHPREMMDGDREGTKTRRARGV